MKFTKAIAQALANKVFQQLLNSRKEFLDQFTVSPEKEAEIKALIAEHFAIMDRKQEIDTLLYKIARVEKRYDDTQESWYKRLIRKIGEGHLSPLPSTDTLVDDFLIESLEVENSNELINKVLAKYSA